MEFGDRQSWILDGYQSWLLYFSMAARKTWLFFNVIWSLRVAIESEFSSQFYPKKEWRLELSMRHGSLPESALSSLSIYKIYYFGYSFTKLPKSIWRRWSSSRTSWSKNHLFPRRRKTCRVLKNIPTTWEAISENSDFQLAKKLSTYHGERKVDSCKIVELKKSSDEPGLRVGYTPRIIAWYS